MRRPFELKGLKPFGVELVFRETTGALTEVVSLEEIESLALSHKLVLVRGFAAPARDEFLDFCRRFRERDILEWNFGAVMELREAQDPKNYLFSAEKVPFHWDGAFAQTPSRLVFSCIEASPTGSGGETLFCDTEAIYQGATLKEKSLFDRAVLRYETEKIAHYGGVAQGPLVRPHPETGRTTLRYSEPVLSDLNPVATEVLGLAREEAGRLQKILEERLYQDRYCFAHEWRPGDFLIADNHALLHGRRAFRLGSPRHIRRIQFL